MTLERVADHYPCPSRNVATVVAAILLGDDEASEANAVGPVVHWKTPGKSKERTKLRVRSIVTVIKQRDRVSA